MMQALASYVMRGRREAVLMAVLLTAMPFLYWFGVAVVLLVALRRGLNDALGVLFWTLLPATGWLLVTGNNGPLMALCGGLVLAAVLRTWQSWQLVLLLSVALGAGGVLLVQALQPELYAATLQVLGEVFERLGAGIPPEAQPADGEQFQVMLESLLLGGWGMWLSLSMLSCVALARWWQSMLFLPGGFQAEMWALRLTPPLSLGLLGLVLGGSAWGGAGAVGWIPLVSLPLIVAGVALVHGLVGRFGLGSGWLIAFYSTFLLLSQFMVLILVLFAFLDSFADFRSRAGNQGKPPGGGQDQSGDG